MFSKILIANRGEIACRIIRTAKRMGIATVIVHSDADRDSLAVEMADEAVAIGPAPSAESYLVIDKIVAACKATGAEAVHPGYGFLSENAQFAERLEGEGVVFIGPGPDAIRVMGDKIQSKKFADAAGVNTVPGYLGEVGSPEEAVKIADDIGYPVMIKASAGGGGKGMRIAYSSDEVAQGFLSSMSEAKASFGDDRMFIEKFVTEPRHIEIQVLADCHGNAVYVGERECSIQRRNQKVIEEAPSSFLDEATRRAMGEQAVALAKAVQYESAGTVEFIVDQHRNFYFLEMNTRLQVEHPVSELITGLDLVEQMFKVASGEPLAFAQDDIKLKGWAFESRIYAEDPYRNFLPSIGRLTRFRYGEETAEPDRAVRMDTGVVEGSEISMYYDPMIAKLCTWAPTREASIEVMLEALDGLDIEGLGHNVPFLSALYEQQRFREGRLTTGYIAEEFPDGFHGIAAEGALIDQMICAAAFAQITEESRRLGISGRLSDKPASLRTDWTGSIGEIDQPLTIEMTEDGLEVIFDSVEEDGAPVLHEVFSDWVPGQRIIRLEIDGTALTFGIIRGMDGWTLSRRGVTERVAVRPPRVAELARLMPEKPEPDTSKMLLCPMPGLMRQLDVEVGQEVKAGEALCVVEAMKMENILRAERDGIIATIKVAPGDSLSVDQVIMEFE